MPIPFFYHPRMLKYDFGPQHPLKPERLRRAIELAGRFDFTPVDPGLATEADLLRVHEPSFVETVSELSLRPDDDRGLSFGFGTIDTPAFAGMFEASLAYVGGSVRAAETVRDGAPLAINLSGGLHHSQRAKASGFCVFDDPAIAIHILLERFERVAYVDIDVHHGDGVQWIWYDDPRVLTCSIHEEGRSLYPGTGWIDETGAEFTSFNVPLQAHTTGDVWLDAFERSVLVALDRFQPEAIVLQMGTDAHFDDPLGHLRVAAQDWVGAVGRIRQLAIPTVAVGGGGYNLKTVPRMWVAACLTLSDIEHEDRIPDDLAESWQMPRFFDAEPHGPSGSGRDHAESVISELTAKVIPNIPRP